MLGDEPTALSTSIEILNLSARTTNALINNDIHTIRDLFALNDAELRDLKGFGSKALDESQRETGGAGALDASARISRS